MSYAALCGIAAMLCWGIADFVQTYPIRRLGTSKTMVLRNLVTLLLASALGTVLWVTGQLQFDFLSLLTVAAGSVMYVLGYFTYMKGFEVGRVSLVAPIASSFSVITVLLTFAVGRESISIIQAISITMIVLGLALASTNLRDLKGFWAQAGLREAIATFFAFGIAFFILGFVSQDVGATTIFVYSATTQAILFLCLGVALGGLPNTSDLTRPTIMIFLVHAVLVNAGWYAYIQGGSTGEVSVVAPIASVFSGVTVVLAAVFYRERINPPQISGIFVVLAGVFLLSR